MNLDPKVIAITGGGGVLGGAMARGLARAGARPVLIGRTRGKLEIVAGDIEAGGGKAGVLPCDVLDPEAVKECFGQIRELYGQLDGLINAAGGNLPGAVVGPDQHFFDLDLEDLQAVFRLNLEGTIIPTREAARLMSRQGVGSIINISSMTARDPLTRVVGYSAAKAGIDNFTKWLAVELATKYGEGLRVNAIAPGFFIGEQNRRLLLNEDGTPTDRGQAIIDHTPMKRFGKAEELVGLAKWLCSDESSFVTGAVIPVDGGFGAWRGV